MRKKNIFLYSRYMGVFFIISSIALLLVFQFYIIRAANTKLPDGNYTELHDLVASCKIYIYCILAIVFAGGITNLVIPPKSKNNTEKKEDTGNSK